MWRAGNTAGDTASNTASNTVRKGRAMRTGSSARISPVAPFRMVSREGFTLFEAVVALMIIGLVAVSTLSAVAAQLRAQERAQRTAEVEALARERMTALELLTADELQSLPDSVARGQFPPPLNQYMWQSMSRPVLGEEYLNDVAVSITWRDGAFVLYSRIYQPPQLLTTGGEGGSGQ